MLWNDYALKQEHEKLGIKYVSEQKDGKFNDSEALAYDVARYIEGDVSKISATGSIAFICIQREHDGEPIALYFARNEGSPLKVKMTNDSITLSSEGKGKQITADTLFRFDYKTFKLTEEYVTIPEYSSYYYTGANSGYEWEDEEEDDYSAYYEGKVKSTKEGLLVEAGDNISAAIEMAEEERKQRKALLADLEVKEATDRLSELEKSDLYILEDEIYYLDMAIYDMKKEELAESYSQAFAPNSEVNRIPMYTGGTIPKPYAD